jgi:hypothetical protein
MTVFESYVNESCRILVSLHSLYGRGVPLAFRSDRIAKMRPKVVNDLLMLTPSSSAFDCFKSSWDMVLDSYLWELTDFDTVFSETCE